MIHFTSERVTPHILRIRDGSDVCEYLAVGSSRAALIDTGYGIGDLKAFVETLTDKPYDVFITHGHVDHAAGAYPFESVYMNPADQELFQRHCTVAFRKSMVEAHNGMELAPEDFLPQRTEPFRPLEDGMEFDLGGLTLRWIHVPGHTAGMMVPLIVEDRAINFGDACGVGTLLALPESSTIQEYLEALNKLKTFEPMYDTILRQHGSCASEKPILDANIENCELILAGKDDAQPAELMGEMFCRARAIDPATGERKDGLEGNIIYDPAKIRLS